MKKTILTLSFLVVIAILFYACKKDNSIASTTTQNQNANISVITRQIADAKAYFENQIATTGHSKLNPIALWENAYIAHTKFGDKIMVALKYDKNYTFTTNFSGVTKFTLAKQAHLSVYKDAAGAYHAEVVTIYPSKSYLDNTDKLFSGYLTIDDWSENNLRTHYFANGKDYIFPKQISGRAAARTTESCTYTDWYWCGDGWQTLNDCTFLFTSSWLR